MVKILFIIPPIPTKFGRDIPSFGILYIASYIRSKIPNAGISLLDYGMSEFDEINFKDKIISFKPDFVGITMTSIQFNDSIKIVDIIKKNSNCKIIMGGVHPTSRPLECIRYCNIVVIGEGEQTFYEIVSGKNYDLIDGIVFTQENKIVQTKKREFIKNLDDIPMPAYDLLDLGAYYKKFKYLGIITSRGCPFDCTFCCSPVTWRLKLRQFSVHRVVDDIEFLYEKYGCEYISFFDDTLNIPINRAIDISNEIIRRGLNKKMKFRCMLRVNDRYISEELFIKLREANFVRVSFGIESGSPKILSVIKKHITLPEIKKAVLLSRGANLDTWGFFMIGNWDETVHDIIRTWILIYNTGIKPNFAIATPFPGTEFWKTLEKNRLLTNGFDLSRTTTRIALVRTNKLSKIQISLIAWTSAIVFMFRAYTPKDAIKWAFDRIIDVINTEIRR